jgi:UDP-glucose 4-epimerase
LSGKEGIFNLGHGIGYSVNDIITHIHRITGLKANVKYIKADSFNVNKVVLDISKAYDTFAWKPNISLEDGLTIHYEWMKDMINKEGSRLAE